MKLIKLFFIKNNSSADRFFAVEIFALLFFVLFSLIIFSSCGKPNDTEGVEEEITSGIKIPLYSTKDDEFDVVTEYCLTVEEIELLEKTLNRETEKITRDMLSRVEVISVCGEHILQELSFARDKEGYYVNGKHYVYGDSYGNELSFLRVFKNLKNLYVLYAPKWTDMSFLGELDKLKSINVYMAGVQDATSLSKLPLLTSVSFESTPVKLVDFYPDNGIESFSLVGTEIADASVLTKLNYRLHLLNLSELQVPLVNADALKRFTALQYLILDAPELDISFLSDMKCRLISLNIKRVKNTELSALRGLSNTLNEITISECEGIDLTALDNLKYLKKIHLKNVKDPIRGEKTKVGASTLKSDVNW